MADVARRAQVSLKTVSRVVNGDAAVAAATAERVREAITGLGYAPHQGARSLRSGRTMRLGLVLDSLDDPFFAGVYDGVAQVARRHDHLLLTCTSHAGPEREQRAVHALLAHGVDGMIATPADPSATALWAQVDVPVAFVDRPVPGLAADTVLSDATGGMKAAVDHLAGLGHRHLAYVGGDPKLWTTGARLEAFEAALAQAGLDPGPAVLGPWTLEGLRGVVQTWADPTSSPEAGVSAVVTGGAEATVGFLRAIRAGVSWRPALVGFGDLSLADLLCPPLTAVAQQAEAMGRTAAALIFRRVLDPHAPPQQAVIATRLVVRGSARPAAKP